MSMTDEAKTAAIEAMQQQLGDMREATVSLIREIDAIIRRITPIAPMLPEQLEEGAVVKASALRGTDGDKA
jgi:hypothetical protein